MTVDINPIPAGHLLAITSGQYSDYDLHGVYRALGVIDTEAEIAAYIAAHPHKSAVPGRGAVVAPHLFLAWLHGRSLLERVDCFELQLGGYDGDPDDINVSEIEG